MELVFPRCAGLDVHKKSVVACLRTPPTPEHPGLEVRTFGTTTAALLALGDWLTAAGCTHAAMESTGVYWKPVYNLLEGRLSLLVVNAQHIKAVPGRKTDVRDAEWIADLLAHGLLRSSFVPSPAQRELRALTRHRITVIADRARVVNRLQKLLEEANIKLASVATDITGVSARAMLDALLAGEADAAVLANLARGRMREKRAELEAALPGRLRPQQRFLLGELLAEIDFYDEAVERVTSAIAQQMEPLAAEVARLDGIPGINARTAQVLLAEVGADMSRFPSAGHLASWAGLCPGNHISAGHRQRGTTRHGNPWLRQGLMEAAHGAAHTKDTVLSAQYRRLAKRIGKRKALVAVAHSILRIVYHVLAEGKAYAELGGDYYEQRDKERITRGLVRRLERMGHEVILKPKEAA